MNRSTLLAVFTVVNISMATEVYSDDPQYDFIKVVHSFQHREKPKGTGGKKSWTEVIEQKGAMIYDYTIHLSSKRGPGTSFRVDDQEGVLTIKGETGYERELGKGGNVEATVVVWFYRPRIVPPGYQHRFKKTSSVGGELKGKDLAEDEPKSERFANQLKLISDNIGREAGVVIRFTNDTGYQSLGNPKTPEERFRAVINWAKANGHYAAFPTFEQGKNADGVDTYEVAVLSRQACQWDDVLRKDLGDPNDLPARFRAVNRWSRGIEDSKGSKYPSGFPTFHESKKDGEVFYGAFYMKADAAVIRSVPRDEFGDPDDEKSRFILAHRYARKEGFATGFPNFENSDKNGMRYYGVVCIKKEFVNLVGVPRN